MVNYNVTSMMEKEIQIKNLKAWIFWGFVIVIILSAVFLIGLPYYNVWEQRMVGKAELSRAEYSRQIAIVEAEAKKVSAEQLAQAEVARAVGVAKANEIIAKSITEPYLRYMWINEVAGQSTQKTVVYIPTEANIPILEASRQTSE